jgi:hypothetical protein
MLRHNNAELFGLLAKVFQGQYLDGVFYRVGRNDRAVVAFGVRSVKTAVEHDRNVQFLDGMARAVADYFENADGHFTIGMGRKFHVALVVAVAIVTGLLELTPEKCATALPN